MGCDAIRAEYYRTRPLNSSPKFRWLNIKAPKTSKSGAAKWQFHKYHPQATTHSHQKVAGWKSYSSTGLTSSLIQSFPASQSQPAATKEAT